MALGGGNSLFRKTKRARPSAALRMRSNMLDELNQTGVKRLNIGMTNRVNAK